MPYVDPKLVSQATLEAAALYGVQHTGGGVRGTVEQPNPPWPDPDNPMLRYLADGALAMHLSGMDPSEVILQAVVHAWYEGNLEGREQQAAAGN